MFHLNHEEAKELIRYDYDGDDNDDDNGDDNSDDNDDDNGDDNDDDNGHYNDCFALVNDF